MRSNKTVRIYTTIVDTDQDGPAADGTIIVRFKNQKKAEAFAAENTYYGRPATVQADDAPARLVARWSFHG